jgi:hypothetical protein
MAIADEKHKTAAGWKAGLESQAGNPAPRPGRGHPCDILSAATYDVELVYPQIERAHR